jgi:D-amino-acid dehydrogenase
MRIAIVGGGIIGVTAAHALLERGHDVTVYDPLGFGQATSRGNAGWIADMDVMPLASPKIWRNLPRWLLDPLGPLAIRPNYLPALAPWLLRFVAASSPARVRAAMPVLADLNGAARPAWERLLAKLSLSHHLKPCGILSVWDDANALARAGEILRFQRRRGIVVRTLDAADLHALEPALGPRAIGGVLYETACRVSDPMLLTHALGHAANERGAQLVRTRVDNLLPHPTCIEVCADGATASYDKVVVAAGAWSRPLAAQLGDRIPLDTERGYNLTLPSGALGLSRPVMFEGHGFVTTPLDTGDRVGGAVEFAGLQAPPNFARVDAILDRLRQFLPHARVDGGTRWMGFRPSIPDSLPVIGASSASRSVVYAFGHAHHGLTQAAATAEAIAALLLGTPAAIDLAPFSAQRF